jgi:hypothetical protein
VSIFYKGPVCDTYVLSQCLRFIVVVVGNQKRICRSRS